jgi:hypothetical protein
MGISPNPMSAASVIALPDPKNWTIGDEVAILSGPKNVWLGHAVQ